MSESQTDDNRADAHDVAPGETDHNSPRAQLLSYVLGFALASALTGISFFIAQTTMVWTPSIPMALAVLAIAQMGVHLAFFLHITTGPDNVNNVMALAFGVLIVFLLIVGSLWIMANLNHNMLPMQQIMNMQR